MNSTWWFQRVWFSCLHEFLFSSLMHTYKRIEGWLSNLSNDDAQMNFNSIADHQNQEDIDLALFHIFKENVLLSGNDAQANFNAIIGHQNPWGVAQALIKLQENNLLSGNSES